MIDQLNRKTLKYIKKYVDENPLTSNKELDRDDYIDNFIDNVDHPLDIFDDRNAIIAIMMYCNERNGCNIFKNLPLCKEDIMSKYLFELIEQYHNDIFN